MRTLVCWLLTLVCLAPPAAGAVKLPEAGRPLLRARQAEHTYDYVGIQEIRTRAGSGLQAVANVAHTKDGYTCQRFIAPARLAGRISIRTPKGRLNFSPRGRGHGPGAWARGLPLDEPEANLALLLRNYELVPEGLARIAGREAQGYLVRPRHPDNPSKRVWLDRETGIILKSVRHNWEGRLVAEAAFRQIKIGRDLPEAAEQCRLPERLPPRRQPPALEFAVVHPSYLPPGYEYLGQGVIVLRGRPAAHLRYGDGLNILSLFEQPGEEPKNFPAARDVGIGQFVFRRSGEMNLAIVGDLPRRELERILESVPGG